MTADLAQRQRALDPTRSFIVQAPAGSGKTEVLTQRYLKLLATVRRPEHVLAITFTRKATQEMRSRIMKRLLQAQREENPPEAHERQAVQLARAVLERDQARGWNLIANPARLRITTIDGLCMQLLARDAVNGPQWAGVRVLEDARPLYREAVRRLFSDIDELAAGQGDGQPGNGGQAAQDALVRLLVHLDGDARRLESMLIDMLQRRTLWQRHVGTPAGTLGALVESRQALSLDGFERALGREALDEAVALVARLAPDLALPQGDDLRSRVETAFRLADRLSTASGSPYKPGSLNRRVFPELDDAPAEVLERLKEIQAGWAEDPAVIAAFEHMAGWPPIDLPSDGDSFPDSLLDDARTVLSLALFELRGLMAERGEADFTAVADAAFEALGEESRPADALLAEDARIQHILMDEFQDTSYTQFGLLTRLTDGWQPDDGRSLFLVGDPMQSIYRFREANVGFFSEVVQHGRLGQVPVEAMTLSSNFRSRRELIDWFNATFPEVFPKADEADSGAVRYTPVEAEKPPGGAVELHVHPPGGGHAEHVAGLVADALKDPANESIAVLVRARGQVADIAAALASAGIAFEAVRMEALSQRPVVQDLRILARALVHPFDRVAWIALLRAPWCGLTMAEIHDVVGDDPDRAVFDAADSALESGALGAKAGERLERVVDVLGHAREQAARQPLSARVEMSWKALGGPLASTDPADLEDAGAFLGLLEEVERLDGHQVIERLEEALEERYAASRAAKVQIMTIHNAKGLEFDFVVIPDLGRKSGRSDAPLVALQEFVEAGGPGGVLMAPVVPRRLAEASLFNYLQKVDAERRRYEDQRVLYVACTRARKQLHLLAKVKVSEKAREAGSVTVPAGTFMAFLADAFEPAMQAMIERLAGDQPGGDEPEQEPPALPLLRISGPLPALDFPEAPGPGRPPKFPDLPDTAAVALGTVLHRWLELMHDHPGHGGGQSGGNKGAQAWDAERIESAAPAIRSALAGAGAPPAALDELQQRCLAALKAAIEDKAWMASLAADRSWSELPLYSRDDMDLSRRVIDLLTQQASGEASGAFEIIDYKSGAAARDDKEESWEKQLQGYRELIERLTGAPVADARVRLLEDDTGKNRAGSGATDQSADQVN